MLAAPAVSTGLSCSSAVAAPAVSTGLSCSSAVAAPAVSTGLSCSRTAARTHRGGRDDPPRPYAGLMTSPAQRYAAARRRGAHPALAEFATGYRFELDPFQTRACEALEDGFSVLVSAPT